MSCSNPHRVDSLEIRFGEYFCPDCRRLIDPKEVEWSTRKTAQKATGMIYNLSCGHTVHRPYSSRIIKTCHCGTCGDSKKVISQIKLGRS